jgi:hypothetical protein
VVSFVALQWFVIGNRPIWKNSTNKEVREGFVRGISLPKNRRDTEGKKAGVWRCCRFTLENEKQRTLFELEEEERGN